MSNPIWPVGLPQDVLKGYRRGGAINAVIASPVSLGKPKTRPRYTSAPRRLDVTVMLDSRAEVATWETFWFETIAYGALPFDWVDPLDESTVTFQIDPGKLDSVEAVHTGGNTYRVDLPLLVLP